MSQSHYIDHIPPGISKTAGWVVRRYGRRFADVTDGLVLESHPAANFAAFHRRYGDLFATSPGSHEPAFMRAWALAALQRVE